MIAAELPTTLQGFFDNAWQHAVVEKNPQSLNEKRECRYRTYNGNACFIGCSIPDHLYRPYMEGNVAITVMESIRAKYPLAPPLELWESLRALQIIHDGWNIDTSGWEPFDEYAKRKLRIYAQTYGLTIPAI